MAQAGFRLLKSAVKLQLHGRGRVSGQPDAIDACGLMADMGEMADTIKVGIPLFPFCYESTQQERQEIGKSIEFAIKSDVLVSQFDTIFHVRIFVVF